MVHKEKPKPEPEPEPKREPTAGQRGEKGLFRFAAVA